MPDEAKAHELRQQHPMWDLLQAYGDACQMMGEHQGREMIHRRAGDIVAVNAAWEALWAHILTAK